MVNYKLKATFHLNSGAIGTVINGGNFAHINTIKKAARRYCLPPDGQLPEHQKASAKFEIVKKGLI